MFSEWKVSGQPYIILNPHFGFYACCPTLLTFGNPAILLIFFLTSFFHCLLPLCCECSPCILNCLYINSTYGKSWADVQASGAGCGGDRSMFVHAASTQAYAITQTWALFQRTFGANHGSPEVWCNPSIVELQSLSPGPQSHLLPSVTLAEFGTFIFFLVINGFSVLLIFKEDEKRSWMSYCSWFIT